jgi:hypothetical protein
MQKDRLNIYVNPDISSAVRELAGHEEQRISKVGEELIALGLSIKKGEIIEQQSLPVIQEIVQSEVRKALAQLRTDLREDMQMEFTNQIKALIRASDNRLAALIVRTIRDSNVARRLIYAMLARSHGPDFANRAYEDAKEKAGRDLARRDDLEP